MKSMFAIGKRKKVLSTGVRSSLGLEYGVGTDYSVLVACYNFYFKNIFL
jgi:hypothetical protein